MVISYQNRYNSNIKKNEHLLRTNLHGPKECALRYNENTKVT